MFRHLPNNIAVHLFILLPVLQQITASILFRPRGSKPHTEVFVLIMDRVKERSNSLRFVDHGIFEVLSYCKCQVIFANSSTIFMHRHCGRRPSDSWTRQNPLVEGGAESGGGI